MPPGPFPPDRYYQSPPNSGANDGATPTVYESNWWRYVNLTPNQSAWFASQPPYLVFYAAQIRSQKELGSLGPQITVGGIPIPTHTSAVTYFNQLGINGILGATGPSATYSFVINGVSYTLGLPQIKTLYSGLAKFINNCHTVEAQMVTNANATPPTITSTSQIDAAFAAIPTVY
jgi:hypothetical protein